ncbi:unnamed protein product [Urochloa humidicola]
MALLEAVVFPPDLPRVVPCCRSCGTSRVLAGYGVAAASAGEFEGIIENGVVVVQEDGEPVAPAPPPPHGGAACCAWAGGAATSSCWVGPAPPPTPTTLATSSALRPARHHQQAAGRNNLRRRRRGATVAKAAEAENLRQNHIAVERGRRRRMNEYLAALRALMPPSYARRGDQAAIVGGAIDFVKELEHHLQSLQAQKQYGSSTGGGSERFPGFFASPQYSAGAAASKDDDGVAAEVEAAVSEGGHATVKVLAPRRRRRMLLGLLLGMQRRGLAALHLNATTTPDQMVLYTFTLKMGDEWQLSSAGDVATAVHDIVAGTDDAEERAVLA